MIAEYRTRTLPVEELKMGRERILLIDESPQFRSVMGRQVLGGQGYEGVIAKSGSEGLALARDLQPDLIVTGYDLPEINGLEIIAALKEAGLNIPTILTTVEGSEALAVQAMRAGVRDYLRSEERRVGKECRSRWSPYH